jgi:dsRNA-specific ribonuclease
VLVAGVSWARGCGRSKQRAEQRAAADAFERRESLRGDALAPPVSEGGADD